MVRCNLRTGYERVLGTKTSPTLTTFEIGPQVFHFGRYKRTLPLVTPGARVWYSPNRGGQVGLTDASGKHSFALDLDAVKGLKVINFWYWHLGMRGRALTRRRKMRNPNRFFRGFLGALQNGGGFTHNLQAMTNEQGAMLFRANGVSVPCITHGYPGNFIGSEEVLFAPQLIPRGIDDKGDLAQDVAMFVFRNGGDLHYEGSYDLDRQRFFLRNRKGEDFFLHALEPFGEAHRVETDEDVVFFTGERRADHEVVLVNPAADQGLPRISPLSNIKVPLRVAELDEGAKDGEKRVLTVGAQIGYKMAETGKPQTVQLARAKTGHLYFCLEKS